MVSVSLYSTIAVGFFALIAVVGASESNSQTKKKVSDIEKAEMDTTFAQLSLGISYFLALKGTLEGEQREDLYSSLYDLYKMISTSAT